MMDLFNSFSDPVLGSVARTVLAVVFLVGGWQKFRDPQVFAAALENYRLLPPRLVPAVATVLPLLEISCGVMLLFPPCTPLSSVLSMLLVGAVTAAVAINLLIGRADIDCGCGGISSQPLSWALVARNGAMMVMLGLARAADERDLLAMDYVTTVAATLALLGLYVCVNQLMTNAPAAVSHHHP